MPTATSSYLRFEGYCVDPSRWTLAWNDEPIALSRKTFDLLLQLAANPGEVQGKEALLNALWPKQVVEESNLTQQIFLLRKALSRHASKAKIIDTVAGRGYVFVARLDPPPVLVECGKAPPPPGSSGAPVRRPAARIGGTRVAAAVAAAGTALVVLGALGWRGWWNHTAASPVAVVLADFDATGDPVLDRALNDALRIDLRQSPFLTVLSPATVKATLATMRRPDDTPLTPVLAREVCERNAAQVLLQGSVSKFGGKYLVSLRASNCLVATGNGLDAAQSEVLAEDKSEVGRPDDLPQAIDSLAAKIRRHLGESRASIRRFDKPLFPANTGSLAALKAYTEGWELGSRGQFLEALPFMKRAVELDPDFGLAYFDIAVMYYMLNDAANERPPATKAYELRNTVSDASRLYISAFYDYVVTGDIAKSIATYKTMIALYPGNVIALGNLADEYDAIGQPGLALGYAERALALMPSVSPAYLTLASAQLHDGQPAEARRTCELAIARNLDGTDLRHVLLQAMAALNDREGVDAQLAWGRAHDDALLLRIDGIELALSHGEVHRAEMLLAALRAADFPPELSAQLEASLAPIGRALAEEGEVEKSLSVLRGLPDSAQDENSLVALAEGGQVERARQGLALETHAHGTATLWKNERLPQVQAAISLAEHRPQDAVSELAPALNFGGMNFGSTFIRAEAYADLGQFDQALAEYQKITRHPTVDPLSSEYPLAVLAEARAYERADQPGKARDDYQKFLDLWKTADPELKVLQVARRDFERVVAQLHLNEQDQPTGGHRSGAG